MDEFSKVCYKIIKIVLLLAMLPVIILLIPLSLFFGGTFGSFTGDIKWMIKGTYKKF